MQTLRLFITCLPFLAACSATTGVQDHAAELRYAHVDPGGDAETFNGVDLSARIPVGHRTDQARFAVAPGIAFATTDYDVLGTNVEERITELRVGLDVEFASMDQPLHPYGQVGVTYVDAEAEALGQTLSASSFGGFAEFGLRVHFEQEQASPYLTAAYRAGFGLSDEVLGVEIDLDYSAFLVGLGVSF